MRCLQSWTTAPHTSHTRPTALPWEVRGQPMRCTGCCLSSRADPNPVSNREFVTMRHHTVCEDGSHLITIQSVNHKEKPFTPGFVRGSTRGARFFRPLSSTGDFELILVDHVVGSPLTPAFPKPVVLTCTGPSRHDPWLRDQPVQAKGRRGHSEGAADLFQHPVGDQYGPRARHCKYKQPLCQ